MSNNLFPMEPTPNKNGWVPVIGSAILAASVNALVVLVTFTPLVLLVKWALA